MMDSIPRLLQAATLPAILFLIYRLYQQWTKKTRVVSLPASQTRKGKPPIQPDWERIDMSTVEPITDFDWTAVPEKPHRPWSGGPHYVTMALQQTKITDWVEIDCNYLSRYTYKQTLLSKHKEKILQHTPRGEKPAHEALELLVDFLPRRYPSMFQKTEQGIKNLVTNDDWDLRPESPVWESYHPLLIMSLLTTEDWFIMRTDEDGMTTRLVAGVSCFPAGWRIQERIGKSLWQIHAGKVPQYEEKLSKSMDRYFVRIRVDSPVMRFNHTVDISPELFHIHSHHNLTVEDLDHPLTVDDLFLRVERQVLQRLPKTRALIFSIRTYVTPISEVTKDEEVARGLRTNVNSYTPDIAKYKNKLLWEKVLADHLDQRLGPEEPKA